MMKGDDKDPRDKDDENEEYLSCSIVKQRVFPDCEDVVINYPQTNRPISIGIGAAGLPRARMAEIAELRRTGVSDVIRRRGDTATGRIGSWPPWRQRLGGLALPFDHAKTESIR